MNNVVHLIDEEWLYESWKRLRKGAANGIDKVSSDSYAENLDKNIKVLLEKLKKGRYQALPVKRVYIPKERDSNSPYAQIN